jgi:dephospho-CoA kinase
MPLLIGLTGGIASGKSQAAELFQQHQIAVIDADQIAKELVLPGSIHYQQIVALFGQDCLLPDGQLNRTYLRKQIFNDSQLKKQLEQILHPAIREALLTKAKQQTSPYVILMVPLLFETQMHTLLDRTVTVDIDESLQHKRLCQRDDISSSLAKSMIEQQFSRQQRLQLSDDIIDNNGSLAILSEQVDSLHQQYLQLAKTQNK